MCGLYDTIRIEDEHTLPEWPHGYDEVSSDEPQRSSEYGWQTKDLSPCMDTYRLYSSRLWKYKSTTREKTEWEKNEMARERSEYETWDEWNENDDHFPMTGWAYTEDDSWWEEQDFHGTITVKTVYPSSYLYDGPTVTGGSSVRWAYEFRFTDGILETVIKL